MNFSVGLCGQIALATTRWITGIYDIPEILNFVTGGLSDAPGLEEITTVMCIEETDNLLHAR